MSNPAPPSWSSALAQAQLLASQARFDACLMACQKILDSHADDPEARLSVGRVTPGAFGELVLLTVGMVTMPTVLAL